MLVLTRKKNESVLIGGAIRLDMVSLARAAVRIRLTAPRMFHPPRGPASREARPAPQRPDGGLGLEIAEITLLNQQVIPLGGTISLGILDADKARVLLFVSAPEGTNVAAVEPEPRDSRRGSTRQNLLQFMKPAVERPEPSPGDATAPPGGAAAPPSRTPDLVPEGETPTFLPFPPAVARKARG